MHVFDLFSLDSRDQTFLQLGELTLALVLSSLIGLERELGRRGAQALVISIGDIKGVVPDRLSPMRHAKE